MKKTILIISAVLLILAMNVTALATGSFVSSPSGNLAPELEDVTVESDACEAEVTITSYAKRTELPQAEAQDMERAYTSIHGANNLTTLNTDLATLAQQKEIDAKNLAVSDLFNISSHNCTPEEHAAGNHGVFSIKLKSETLKNFVALLHWENGKWELVDNAAVQTDGTLKFKVDSFSPFAIVVNTEPPATTGDQSHIYTWAIVAIASVAAFAICLVKFRGQTAK